MTWTKDHSEAVIDGVLKFVATGGFLTTIMIAPGATQIWGKPLAKLMKGLDEKQAQREMRRITYYMKERGLIKYNSNDYEHGIMLTAKGRQHLDRRLYHSLTIPKPALWDDKWRIVFFDIPETEKYKRNALNLKLKTLGFKQLQISIWVHPFPSRSEIEMTCEVLGIRKYVTYIETEHIDSSDKLHARFKRILTD